MCTGAYLLHVHGSFPFVKHDMRALPATAIAKAGAVSSITLPVGWACIILGGLGG